jgi:hypothetical protein
MKVITAFAALAIVAWGAAGASGAADPPATPSATPVKHPSLKACNQQADARKLTGKERSHFVLDCKAGKTP